MGPSLPRHVPSCHLGGGVEYKPSSDECPHGWGGEHALSPTPSAQLATLPRSPERGRRAAGAVSVGRRGALTPGGAVSTGCKYNQVNSHFHCIREGCQFSFLLKHQMTSHARKHMRRMLGKNFDRVPPSQVRAPGSQAAVPSSTWGGDRASPASLLLLPGGGPSPP